MAGIKVGSIAGQKFGKLTAISQMESEIGRAYKWLFKCDCGKLVSYPAYQVRNGMRVHCGCDPTYVARLIREANHGNGAIS